MQWPLTPFAPREASDHQPIFIRSGRAIVHVQLRGKKILSPSHVSHFSLSRSRQQSELKRQQSEPKRQQSAPEKQQSVPQQIVVQNRKNLSPFPKNLISSQPEGVPLPPIDPKPRFFYF
jgi:hypothetical protein